MKRYLIKLLSLALAMMSVCAVQASALEYSFDGANDFLFGRPTSDDTIYEWENPNVDRSKNVALIAPRLRTAYQLSPRLRRVPDPEPRPRRSERWTGESGGKRQLLRLGERCIRWHGRRIPAQHIHSARR